MAVCRLLLAECPARIVVAARRKERARNAIEQLRAAIPKSDIELTSAWGDVFLRTEWQGVEDVSRAKILADARRRRRFMADILEPLSEDIVEASLLYRMIAGHVPNGNGAPPEIVIDCINTATAVSYQNVYALASDLARASCNGGTPRAADVEALIASLYIPQLVRHIQLLHRSLQDGRVRAYIKVGTSGTGGMGLNIPYTHGEEKPSRLLMSKAAIAGAQTNLTFLMARTPGGPDIVKEIKPAAVIGWREIGHGPILLHGRGIALTDCSPEAAVPISDPASLKLEGEFGEATGGTLEGVYIDTGENGQFSLAEFTAITGLGQMQLVTPEEIAGLVLRELAGGNTGHDVVGAFDASVAGPSYRGGVLRQFALDRLTQLEHQHGEAIAFEILGPPRLSKLLFEASLLKRSCKTINAALKCTPEALAAAFEACILGDTSLRRQMISVGIPILLPDGKRLLRGPRIKTADAHAGWVDLTPANMTHWKKRLATMREQIFAESREDTSSRSDHIGSAVAPDRFDIGEIVTWIFNTEEGGTRGK